MRIIWTSFKSVTKKIYICTQGFINDKKENKFREHPTPKNLLNISTNTI